MLFFIYIMDACIIHPVVNRYFKNPFYPTHKKITFRKELLKSFLLPPCLYSLCFSFTWLQGFLHPFWPPPEPSPDQRLEHLRNNILCRAGSQAEQDHAVEKEPSKVSQKPWSKETREKRGYTTVPVQTAQELILKNINNNTFFKK